MSERIKRPNYGNPFVEPGSEPYDLQYPQRSPLAQSQVFSEHYPNQRQRNNQDLQLRREEQRRQVEQLFQEAEKEYGPVINDSIDKMTPEDAKEALRKIHKQLGINCRSVDPRYRTEHSFSNHRNKEFIAPESDLKEELLREYLEAIKKIDDRKKRAVLAYHAVDNLHYFSDGNGRTARAVYLLITQNYQEDSEQYVPNPEQYVMHDPVSPNGWMTGSSDYDGSEHLYFDQGVVPAETVRTLANILLQERLVAKGSLPSELLNTTISVESKSGTLNAWQFNLLDEDQRIAKGFVDVWMSAENRAELSEKEDLDLRYALSDGVVDGECSSLAGLALAATLKARGTLNSNIDLNMEDDRELTFIVNYDKDSSDYPEGTYDERVLRLLGDWKLEDYKSLIRNYRELKHRHNRIIMSIFTENLCLYDGRSIVDWAVGKPSLQAVNLSEEKERGLLVRFLSRHP
ncbi:Fic family protein [Candidatus Saccharibacteria bacterium]|nr:Fic family protein [Candidatus Saccharibacteria bacterium]